MKKQLKKEVIIYQAKSGALELKGDFSQETLWATQAQIAKAFGVDVRTVNEHAQNIYKSRELTKKATIRKFRIVQKEGKREVKRDMVHYNLDMILSIGYRVNSKTATKFRQWATKTLKEHLTKGYTLNRKLIAQNHKEFMKSVASIQKLLPQDVVLDPKDILELIKEFSSTWVSLDAYDRGVLKPVGTTKKSIQLTGEELREAIGSLRRELMVKKEATDIFAQERAEGAIEGIVGSVMQSFGGKTLYPTIEEKAAHLLYFMIKDHPFVDGNKRCGAFAFIWFLRKTHTKKATNMNASALTALTLLVAESDPKQKEQMTALITQLLKE